MLEEHGKYDKSVAKIDFNPWVEIAILYCYYYIFCLFDGAGDDDGVNRFTVIGQQHHRKREYIQRQHTLIANHYPEIYLRREK